MTLTTSGRSIVWVIILGPSGSLTVRRIALASLSNTAWVYFIVSSPVGRSTPSTISTKGDHSPPPLPPLDFSTSTQKAQAPASLILKRAEFLELRNGAVVAKCFDVAARLDDCSEFALSRCIAQLAGFVRAMYHYKNKDTRTYSINTLNELSSHPATSNNLRPPSRCNI